jgi:hypothetical protein
MQRRHQVLRYDKIGCRVGDLFCRSRTRARPHIKMKRDPDPVKNRWNTATEDQTASKKQMRSINDLPLRTFNRTSLTLSKIMVVFKPLIMVLTDQRCPDTGCGAGAGAGRSRNFWPESELEPVY